MNKYIKGLNWVLCFLVMYTASRDLAVPFVICVVTLVCTIRYNKKLEIIVLDLIKKVSE